MNVRRLLPFLGAIWAMTGVNAIAQQWPDQPVRVVVPFAAGGGTDILARLMTRRFSDSVGQGFLVDNRAGAGGNIGAGAVAKAAPNGNTLLITTTTLAINASASRSINFDPVKELQAVSQIMSSPLALCVPAGAPANSAAELVALAKTRPDGLNAASASMGSTSHISIEMLKMLTGARVTHIPYNGSGPATTAVLSGAVDLFFATSLVARPQMQAGKFRCLAVTTARPSESFPGLAPLGADFLGFEMDLWYALFAPAGTPADRVARMNQEVARALASAEVRGAIVKEGGEPKASTPQDMAALFRNDVARYARVVKAAGLQMD